MVKYSPDADKPEALVGVDYDSAMGGSFCIGKTAVMVLLPILLSTRIQMMQKKLLQKIL